MSKRRPLSLNFPTRSPPMAALMVSPMVAMLMPEVGGLVAVGHDLHLGHADLVVAVHVRHRARTARIPSMISFEALARVSQSRPRIAISTGKPAAGAEALLRGVLDARRAGPGIAFARLAHDVHELLLASGRCPVCGSAGRSPGSFRVTNTMPVLTSPPPKPPIDAEVALHLAAGTAGTPRPAGRPGRWRRGCCPPGVWKRARNRPVSWLGTNSLRSSR